MPDWGKENFNVTQESLSDSDKKKLEEIVKQINELNDGENTNNDKIENMSWVLTTEFSKRLSPETAKKLLDWIPSFSEEQEMPEWLQDLINFLEPIANKFSVSVNWALTNDTWTFKSKIDQSEWDSKSKLDEFKEKRGNKERELFPEWQNITDERLKNIKETTDKINKIIEKPNEANTKILQKFIYENLDESDKTEFEQKNCIGKVYNDDNFDWKFWISTLTYLDKVLQKIERYVNNVKESITVEEKNKPSEWKEDEPFENVTVKENFSIKWVSSVNAKDLIDGLPDGASAEFKDEKWINIEDLYKDDKKFQEVTVIVRIWDKTREITINAELDANNQLLILEEKQNTVWTPEKITTPIDTTPYVDNEGNKYQVMGNSQTIAGNANLHWVTFYTAAAFNGAEPGNGEQWQTFETPANGDYECLMKMWDSVYKVKVDQNWNLCPTAVNMMSNVPVVMENSTSGMAYIKNKLPDTLKGKGIKIRWDWEDYAISLPWWWKYLTIEPMAIDWKWIWNLTDSLAFLNLTNYLRNSWKMHDIEFKDDNPDLKLEWNDLYVRVKKTRDVNWKKVKLLKVNKDTFWLTSDEKLLKKYISYNNGEDWNNKNNKRDKKKPNKYYKRVKL